MVVREGVTIQAAQQVVDFRRSTTIAGVVSNGKAGEAVLVQGQECGKPVPSGLATATSTSGGAWSYTARPTINTSYQVRWRTFTSPQLTVRVRPKVALRKQRAGRFTATVIAAQSFVGRNVVLQRRSSAFRWKTVRRVVLRTQTVGIGETTSAATFRSRLRRGTRLRAVLPQAQAGTCYAAARSSTVRA